MNKLSHKHLTLLCSGLAAGYLTDARGLQSRRLAQPRLVYDETRHRYIPAGDYELTAWGREVAENYAESAERKPVGTLLNHRIHAYRRGTVELANDSGECYLVDTTSPIRVRMSMDSKDFDGIWYVQLRKLGWAVTSGDMAWFLRNFLDLDIEVVTY